MASFKGQDIDQLEGWYSTSKKLKSKGVDVLDINPNIGQIFVSKQKRIDLRNWSIANKVHFGYQDDDFKAFIDGEEIFGVDVFMQHHTAFDAVESSFQTNAITHGVLRALSGTLDSRVYYELEVIIRKI